MLNFLRGRLHSNPEPCGASRKGQATSELVCRVASEQGVPMGNSVKRLFRRAGVWLGKHHVALVAMLSALHIGLSVIHVRDSGGADPFLV